MQISPAICRDSRQISAADRSVRLHQRAGRRQCVRSTGADGRQVVVGLDDVAGSGDREDVGAVHDDHHRFEPTQDAIAPPLARHLDRGALEVAAVAFEVPFELLEEGEGVGGTAGKANEHLAAEQRAHLDGAVLDGRIAERDLAVAADRAASVAQHREYRGGTDLHGVLPWAATQPPRRVRARGWAASKLARSRLRPRWV
jgi:hypothetical protein